MGRLSGKVVIVTGAASGMGAAEAELFAKEGAKVVATDVQEELLNKIVDEIVKAGGDAIALSHNVASEEEWKKVVKVAKEKYGKIDVLVNNAGISGNPLGTPESTNIDEWNKVMDINLKGTFLGVKYVVPEMKEAGGGSIINISSVAGLKGNGGPTAYTATKGGVRLLTKNIAFNYGADNIRANSVHPGAIKTAMMEDAFNNEEVIKPLLSTIPLGYGADPIDVAYGVLFLASDEARYITGSELVIDGGMTAI